MQKINDFEEMLSRMQDIASQLENGKLKLEEAMALYTEGMNLSRECAKVIDEAKQTVEMIGRQDGEAQ